MFLFFAPALPESAFWMAASADGSERRMAFFAGDVFVAPTGSFAGGALILIPRGPGLGRTGKKRRR